MGIELRRFPEHHVTLAIFSGAVDSDQISALYSSLDQRDRGRWVGYWHDDVDISGVDVANIPRLKHLVAQRRKEIFGDALLSKFAAVHSPGSTEELFRFLQNYFATGDVRVTPPRIFSNLETAFDWLGLSDEARKELTDAARRAGEKPAYTNSSTRSGPGAAPQISGSHGQAPR
jgi:hypothetical protein